MGYLMLNLWTTKRCFLCKKRPISQWDYPYEEGLCVECVVMWERLDAEDLLDY